jgi:patatin-like phospholipase/acyl hydrolase
MLIICWWRGIRGIIPATNLIEIVNETKKPIYQIFDLMAWTSAGGIVTAGLCKKDNEGNPQYSDNDLIEIFRIFII